VTYQVDKSAEGDIRPTERHWSCEDDEIEKLIAFLTKEFPQAGKYHMVKDQGDVAGLIKAVRSGGIESRVIGELIDGLVAMPDAATIIGAAGGSSALAGLIRQHRQQVTIDALQVAVEKPESTEPEIHKELNGQWWIFGGRFISQASRRRVTVLDELDIPLIRSDGALHVVELKKANIPELVVSHRNHAIVGEDVHKATAQAMNYLRELDEHRAHILADLKIDCRRAFATVVIGHPTFVKGDWSETEIHEAIRTYNSGLSRIEVITYKDLIDGARRAFTIAGED
jgi:hypothetical protein